MVISMFLYYLGDPNDGETFVDLLLKIYDYSKPKIKYFHDFLSMLCIVKFKENSPSF